MAAYHFRNVFLLRNFNGPVMSWIVSTEFGRLLASKNLTLVFGGYAKGLMGTVAKGVVEGHGKVIGVTIPLFMGEADKLWSLLHC